jgi:hypothetical protein
MSTNPGKEDAKAARERAIFHVFLACEGAPAVEAGTVESREPPEPDILCTIADRGPTAFELVEIIERDWRQLIGDHMRLQNALYVKHEQRGTPLADAYRDALVFLRYRPDATISQREKAIPALFAFLHGLPPGFTGDATPGVELAPILRSVGISRVDFDWGPLFQVGGAHHWVGDPAAESIQGKWIKTYDTQHPIELLAYYSLQSIPAASWIGPVQSFVDANWTTSPFRKVWICDLNSKRILFAASRE